MTIETRRLEQYRSCGYQASLTAGTIFHRTRKPLRLWFLAIFFLGRHKTGISALQLQKDLGLGSYETAWAWLHNVRSALRERPDSSLTGLVEADETYVGAKRERGVRGRKLVGKSLVAVLVENRGERAGALRLAALPEASQAELGPFVRGAVDSAPTAAGSSTTSSTSYAARCRASRSCGDNSQLRQRNRQIVEMLAA